MNRRWVKRLYEQLPVLIDKGIVSSETAERLRDYYGSPEKKEGQKAVVVIFSILGSLCIGLGIVLLLAYNWTKQLPVSVRTILSILPLVFAQALVLWTMRRRSESDAWMEGSASFLFLMTGASTALVTQIYHISNEYFDFFLTWMLLGVPLVYLMRVTMPAILYVIGITAWLCSAKCAVVSPMFYWLLAVLVVPHILQTAKNNSYAVRSAFLGWVVSICLCVAVGVTLGKIMGAFGTMAYGCLFAVLYLAGLAWFNEDTAVWRRPFQTVGILGILVISFVLTFNVQKWTNWNFPDFTEYIPQYLFAILLAGIYGLLLAKFVRTNRTVILLYLLLPLLAAVIYALSAFQSMDLVPSLLANLYLLALGVSTISAGLKNERLDVINGGMLILMAWIVARFFDWDLGFIVRGIAFIIIGIGFLVINFMLVRNRRRSKT